MPQTSLAAWLQRKKPHVSPEPVSTSTAAQAPETPPRLPTSPTKSRTPTDLSYIQTSGVSLRPLAKLLPLPANVFIEPCTEQHISQFRRLNTLLLPIPYPEDFYRETLADQVIASLTRVALWCEDVLSTEGAWSVPTEHTAPRSDLPTRRLVASIRCRLLPCPPDDPSQDTPILYISTITTLAPFRRHALASHLLAAVTRTAMEQYGASAIMAHVWEANEEGMEWYKNRGFKIVAMDATYYRRLAPQTAAYIVRRDIGPGDMLDWEKMFLPKE